jgi:tRNA modification GTPase
MLSLDDTIAAISTPVGEAGIGIVRMTGPEAAPILQSLFIPASGDGLLPRLLHYGHIVDPAAGERVDEVLAVYMPAPRTYTRQDVVEVHGHGGIVALRRILGLCLGQGARLAEPGEFTARAFLNGRLDLAQAEAVLDIIQAKTETSLQAAVEQLSGRLSVQVREIREVLLGALAHLEASIDFAEDEIPERDIVLDLEQAAEGLQGLLAQAERGIIYRQGVRVAIVGRPNVGKSSLLNRLLRVNRAIVTDIPGTTRDTLEETINLQGIPLVLVDTAGITAQATDPVERLGVERSRSALAGADLVLLMVDATQPLTQEDRAIASLVEGQTTLLVANKIDLRAESAPLPERASLDIRTARTVGVSALTGEGLHDLESAIVETVFSGQVTASEAPAVTNPRHKEALARALVHVHDAQEAHRSGVLPDLVSIDLSAAVHLLGEITGQTASEDLVDRIFGSFCVGK